MVVSKQKLNTIPNPISKHYFLNAIIINPAKTNVLYHIFMFFFSNITGKKDGMYFIGLPSRATKRIFCCAKHWNISL